MDVKETVSVSGGLLHELETAHIRDTNPPWSRHDQTAIYEPETEQKPYILTIQMEGQLGLEEVAKGSGFWVSRIKECRPCQSL